MSKENICPNCLKEIDNKDLCPYCGLNIKYNIFENVDYNIEEQSMTYKLRHVVNAILALIIGLGFINTIVKMITNNNFKLSTFLINLLFTIISFIFLVYEIKYKLWLKKDKKYTKTIGKIVNIPYSKQSEISNNPDVIIEYKVNKDIYRLRTHLPYIDLIRNKKELIDKEVTIKYNIDNPTISIISQTKQTNIVRNIIIFGGIILIIFAIIFGVLPYIK